jgi:hypothetical protein
VYTEWNQGAENRAHRLANFGLASGRRPEGCSSRSTRNSCLKAGRDGSVRQFCLKAIDIDLAQQIKESQNSEAKATSFAFGQQGLRAIAMSRSAVRTENGRCSCISSLLRCSAFQWVQGPPGYRSLQKIADSHKPTSARGPSYDPIQFGNIGGYLLNALIGYVFLT